MKTIKMQAKNVDWEYAQEIKQAKKQAKEFRKTRQSRKGFWQSAE